MSLFRIHIIPKFIDHKKIRRIFARHRHLNDQHFSFLQSSGPSSGKSIDRLDLRAYEVDWRYGPLRHTTDKKGIIVKTLRIITVGWFAMVISPCNTLRRSRLTAFERKMAVALSVMEVIKHLFWDSSYLASSKCKWTFFCSIERHISCQIP